MGIALIPIQILKEGIELQPHVQYRHCGTNRQLPSVPSLNPQGRLRMVSSSEASSLIFHIPVHFPQMNG